MLTRLVIVSLLSLSACSTPRLPDPGVRYPEPPAELMKKPERPKPIETKN
jgi:hypothetical protein